MHGISPRSDVPSAPPAALLRAAVDELLAVDVEQLDTAALAALLEEVELQRRRLDAADVRLIAAAEPRRRGRESASFTVVDLLIGRLRIDRRGAMAAALIRISAVLLLALMVCVPLGRAVTEPAPPPGYTSADLVWQDTFTGATLDASKWNTYMTSAASNGSPWNASKLPAGCSAINPPGGNYGDYDCASQITVNNGLTLNMSPDTTVTGYKARGAVVTTYGHFALTSGYVQVRAEMPDVTTGGWPAIWFISDAAQRGEIDLYDGGFTAKNARLPTTVPANNVFSTGYHGPTTGLVQAGYNAGDLTTSYHLYGMQYIPGKSIKTYIDGHLVGNWTTDINTDPYELIMSTGQATSATCCWHTQGKEPADAMRVSSVQVYQH